MSLIAHMDKTYEHVLHGVSASTNHFGFSERGSQTFCMHMLYISFIGCKYCYLYIVESVLAQILVTYSGEVCLENN